MRILLLSAISLLLVARASAGDIVWEQSLEEGLAKAKAENKPLFLAVNMDGERANELLATKTYHEKSLVELTSRTVNVLACAQEHASAGKPCPRFEGLQCIDHRRTDNESREKILKADSQGNVIAPQHVWLSPEGKVLLSVPYAVTLDELTWCMVSAIAEVDPATTLKLPPSARSPRRLVNGAVFDPGTNAGGLADRPPTRQEALDIIKEMKKSWFALEKGEDARRLLMSDEPEVLEFVQQQLRGSVGSFLGGGAGGAGGKGGGGGGGAGGAGGRGGNGGGRFHAMILHQIGIVSPSGYWELVSESLGNSDREVRAEAAVALEQLAVPESLRALNAALQKEDDVSIKKDILRAIGSAGANDAKTRAALIKRAKSDKEDVLRWNSTVALGFATIDPEVVAFLQACLAGKDPRARTAAACALGLSRDKQFIPFLKAQAAELPEDANPADKQAAGAIGSALAVLNGAPFREIEPPIQKICADTIDRERWFPSRKPQ
ncbi:MAG TPA: HEAT repeat domain-containing protein [Planctomycetota bacterium]|nr:HEAT repeat domain-containing protein [Planctomycetota bacterium]